MQRFSTRERRRSKRLHIYGAVILLFNCRFPGMGTPSANTPNSTVEIYDTVILRTGDAVVLFSTGI